MTPAALENSQAAAPSGFVFGHKIFHYSLGETVFDVVQVVLADKAQEQHQRLGVNGRKGSGDAVILS